MSKWVHKISGVHPDTQTGTCAECGPVDLYFTGKRWECRNKRRENKARYRKPDRHRVGRPDGSCEICGSTERLVVDHDHSCCPYGSRCHNCIRGTLCSLCNAAIGFMADDPERLEAAADYLRKTKKSPR